MPKDDLILLDEIHITVFAASKLGDPYRRAAARLLRSKRFRTRLASAIQTVFRRHQATRKLTIHIAS